MTSVEVQYMMKFTTATLSFSVLDFILILFICYLMVDDLHLAGLNIHQLVLRSAPHAENCIPDNSILSKMEKKNDAEEMKPISQIYSEEANSASVDLETAWQFPTYKNVKTAMYIRWAKRFPLLPATHQQLEIPPHWRVTKSGRQFLLYNNVYNCITRVIV
ncbi:hypothetical protein T10_11660 [Trichinella papuae]|uniref:Uncharacterized protein n=1 Tax=Trichinella papuae TaxID=268474 RepID=A0A0V1MFU0_9BILA|nr:hypothetical protein T10_11660 [Trichinella papuae]